MDRGLSQSSRTGRWTLGEVRDGSGDPQGGWDGSGESRGSPGRVGAMRDG